MSDALVLGLDSGTSSFKAVLLDRTGRIVDAASATYPTTFGPGETIVQDAEDWLRAMTRTVRSVVSGHPAREIGAIALAGVAHNVVLTGRDGRPLAPVLRYDDGRCQSVIGELEADLGELIRTRTLTELAWGWSLPQLVWLRAHHPDLWRRLDAVHVQKDFLRHHLTGDRLSDPSDATGTGLYDQRERRWVPEALARCGLRPDQLGEVRPSASVAGGLVPTWARRLGLASGTPVVVGATDTCAELVSLGALEPGASIVKAASTGTVVAISDRPIGDARWFTYPHAVPDRWYSLTATNTAAPAVQWLARGAPTDAAVARVPPGADGLLFLPFIEGERAPYWDRRLRGALLGLRTAHTPQHIHRAAIEGVAFSLRDCRDLMARAGFDVSAPFVSGGVMANRTWRRIVAAVLDDRVRIAEPQGPAVGAAALARAAIGDGAIKARPRVRVERPDPAWALAYQRRFGVYQAAVAATREISHRLAGD